MKNKRTSLSPVVLGKLGSLRRALRGRLFVEGLAWLVLAAAGLVVVTLAFDYTLRLDRPLRITILTMCGLFVLHVLWRRLFRPMLAPMSARGLVLLLERKFTRLDDRLISALELSRDTGPNVSQAMVAHTTVEAESIVQSLPVRQIVETRRMWRTLGLAVAVGVLLAGFTLWQPNIMQLWFQRNVLLSNVDWPQRTYLSVYYVDNAGRLQPLLETDATGAILQRYELAEVLRGETFEVVVASANGSVAPEAVTLHVRYPSVGDTEERLNPLSPEQAARYRPDAKSESRTLYRKRFGNVNEAFRFYAIGGDDRRDARQPHRLTLVDAPALADVQFTVTSPAYMRRARPTVLTGHQGVLPIPHGATVRISALANKPLRSAQMLLDGKDAAKLRIDADNTDAAETNRRLMGTLKLGGRNVSATRTLTFALQDTEGYASRRRETYVLQILPDRSPTVNLHRRGVRHVICPTARIPLDAEAKDDHGLASIRMVHRIVEKDVEKNAATTQPTTAPTWRHVGTPIAISPDTPTQQTGSRVLDIAPQKLLPGTKLFVRAEVLDTLPANLDGPNRAASTELAFEIISRESLLAQLVGKQKEARMEFFQAMGQQELARGRCVAAATDLAAGTIRPENLQKLRAAANLERQVTNESTKVADTLAAVGTEMELNRLGQPEEHAALRDDVVAPLRKLIETMRSISADLDAACVMKDAAKLVERTQAIATRQQDVYRAMEAILANMRKLENRLELARRLEGLLKMSVELDAILRRRVERDIEDLFDESNTEKKNRP